ncbi:putative ubiquinone biosynthesis protein [Eremomyces bilateralis CBS 781.70]|uniref:Ubiquinone biosynthesis protein n=1 Tax=Eremomyces bilateralis CBS 781.70 TaxID=1392243 RepID=A0A6G1G8X7_9PEZI|nr:putative ubiquinone biosynthesis protein [Eremomyces bilateralis CBS 781.70]KAF1814527.1 putative ubiquinone biosynthesis protein [Eremomyces bilateralis CBS 781.70]
MPPFFGIPRVHNTSWICNACTQSLRNTPLRLEPCRQRLAGPSWIPQMRAQATKSGNRSHGTPNPKRSRQRRRVLLAVGGTGLLAAATVSDDAKHAAKHAAKAVERTGSIVSTLAVCVNDYRVTLNQDYQDAVAFDTLLKACHKRCALRTLKTMERNGSIFIKLGQHLSSLNYLLPPEWCETFVPLQDKCPVSAFEEIEAMILKDTGRPWSDFFDDFEPTPIGAASLAQVHIATMKETGQKVAVKVQHPALDEWASLDLALTRFSFATLKYWFPEYDLTWLSNEMELSLPQELDFDHEAANANRIREYFARVPNTPLVIPQVLWSRRRIIVMEYLAGSRPDNLTYLDANHIDRDEVAAALARIFNEMIFGTGAPLHCDPHAGNLAIRHRPASWWSLLSLRGRRNFDIVLYDHGLYRDIPEDIRRGYAKLWLAVLNADEPGMRKYANEVANVGDEDFPLFASAITGRDYSAVQKGVGVASRDQEEKKMISQALSEGLLTDLVQLLGRVPRVLLLILKTNDLTRALDDTLQTRRGSARAFLILARYASRTVYEEQLERLRGSFLRPSNFVSLVQAWGAFVSIRIKLRFYEIWLGMRSRIGMDPVTI